MLPLKLDLIKKFTADNANLDKIAAIPPRWYNRPVILTLC